jgi:hypothetical protein
MALELDHVFVCVDETSHAEAALAASGLDLSTMGIMVDRAPGTRARFSTTHISSCSGATTMQTYGPPSSSP